MKISSLILIAVCMGFTATAGNRCQEEWKKKMMAEKIAFLTMETGITPEEAQAFWPVYNQVNQERDNAMHEVFKAYRQLDRAVTENKAANEIETLLNDYLKALDAQRELDGKIAERYKAVLPVEKVAKLFISEERFRRQHIRRLNGSGDGKAPKK